MNDGWTCPQNGSEFNNLITAWKDNFRVQLNFCGLVRDNWAFDYEEDSYTLFNAIELFYKLTGVMPSIPVRTGRLILENSINRKIQNISDNPTKYFNEFIQYDEKQILYLREPSLLEQTAKYVHAFDKRAMFLGACGIHLGETEYKEVENDYFHHIYEDSKNTQGLILGEYYFKENENSFIKEIYGEGQNAIYTPTARLISEKENALIKIHKGYIWKTTRKPLEKFYSNIRTSIKTIRQTDDEILHAKLVEKSLKAIYTRFVGWLASSSHTDGRQSNLYRPDWRCLIIAEANARLLRNILEVEEKTGLRPIGIRYDEVLYFSNEKNTDKLFANTCLLNPVQFQKSFTLEAGRVREAMQQNFSIGKICDLAKKGEL